MVLLVRSYTNTDTVGKSTNSDTVGKELHYFSGQTSELCWIMNTMYIILQSTHKISTIKSCVRLCDYIHFIRYTNSCNVGT